MKFNLVEKLMIGFLIFVVLLLFVHLAMDPVV